jgi:hypothetical protein
MIRGYAFGDNLGGVANGLAYLQLPNNGKSLGIRSESWQYWLLRMSAITEDLYVSLSLVHSCRINRGRNREIGDARTHHNLLDDCAWHYRIDYWRSRNPHVFASG